MGAWCVVAAGACCGCSHTADFVHPDFSNFRLQRIGVFDVENATVYRLNGVSFGGFVQRNVFGVPQYDIPAVLRAALEEALLLKNYETLTLGPQPTTPRGDPKPASGSSPDEIEERSSGLSPAVAESPTVSPAVEPDRSGVGERGILHDAEIFCTILYWHAKTGATPELSLRFRLELVSVVGREKLYAGTFPVSYKQGKRNRSRLNVSKLMRSAVKGALAELPPAVPESEL